jgi:hypothetical protein
MGEMHGGDPSRFEDYEGTVEFRLVLGIAEALREEFGVSIDAHPGGEGNEAGVVNRMFRAAAGVILKGIDTPGDDMSFVLIWTLRKAALRRLIEIGLSERQAQSMLDSEPGLGNCWLAYLALAPAVVIADAGSNSETG